jgi:hypothetical protein
MARPRPPLGRHQKAVHAQLVPLLQSLVDVLAQPRIALDSADVVAAFSYAGITSINEMAKKPGFPAPIFPCGARSPRWLLSELVRWAETSEELRVKPAPVTRADREERHLALVNGTRSEGVVATVSNGLEAAL